MMFRYFGYAYITQPPVDRILKQIRNPQEDYGVYQVLSMGEGTDIWPDLHPYGVAVLSEPAELRCFLVGITIRPQSQRQRQWAIVLPPSYPEGLEVYDRWKALSEEELRKLVVGINVVDRTVDYLGRPPKQVDVVTKMCRAHRCDATQLLVNLFRWSP